MCAVLCCVVSCTVHQQAFKYLVKDKKELEGLEPTTLAVAAQKAAAEGHKGATAESGPWLLTLDYTTYSSVVSFAKNRDLREKFYRAYRRIGADGNSDNTDIIRQILKLRQQLARMLGFKSYAEESFLSRVSWILALAASFGYRWNGIASSPADCSLLMAADDADADADGCW